MSLRHSNSIGSVGMATEERGIASWVEMAVGERVIAALVEMSTEERITAQVWSKWQQEEEMN